MEDEMILKQPSDRRLAGDTNDLPPGPPGAENDEEYNDTKKEEKSVAKESFSKSRRRSPSGSPPPSKRKSPSRGPRSPRGRRTPSPRRRFGRKRDYSPDRRRFNDRGSGRTRRSPIRNRSRDRMDHRRNGRDRFRGGRRDSRSRSNSLPSRRRWSPKKKPSSPPVPPSGAQYGVPAAGMYADPYSAYGPYVPPQQYGPGEFVGAPPPAAFGAYPPPPTWGLPAESYQQPNWVPQPEPLPPAVLQPQPVLVVQQTASVQPPGTQPQPPTIGTDKKIDVNPTHDAVAQEAENQRDELKKQRTNYLKKTAGLKKELKVLKEQRKDLIGGDGSQSPTTKGFLDENERLQSQIQKKLSTIENVIDMLTGIIGPDNLTKDDEAESPRKNAKKKRTSSSSSGDSSSSTSSSSSSSSSSSDSEDNSSPEHLKTKAIESMKHKRDVQGKSMLKEKKIKDDIKKTDDKKINYVFYDPEMHWCKTCDAFPKTAKDFLTHLHSKEHSEHVDTMETPWHTTMSSDEYPLFEGAPTKRTPIRGLTFFVPATAWYCKLCSVWMGDLHCASLHLKSKTHSNKYNTFLEKNPHFEVDWLADRQRVFNVKKFAPPPPQITCISTTGGLEQKEVKSKSKHEDKEKTSKKRKKKSSDKKDKKKKKRSKKRKKAAMSSSSFSNDSSSENDAKAAKNKLINAIPVSTGTAPSIRVQMRNLNKEKDVEMEIIGPAPPPPPTISEQPSQPFSAASPGETNKRDDLISQWNLVQPVISDKEKKLFEQLKGKLKNKPPPKEEEEKNKRVEKVVVQPPVATFVKSNDEMISMGIKERMHSPLKRSADRGDKDKEKDRDNDREHGINRRRSRSRPSRRSKSRSPSRGKRIRRSRSRGGGIRRSRSRGRRSPSRSRYSPRGYGRRRRSRSARRRSRSHGRSRRRLSPSRSRSRSGSHRIEKPIIRQPEFRPRVPEVSSVKKNKTKTNEEKEERKKSSSSSSTVLQSNKKLPFIGRMPVFKKQSQNSENSENPDKKDGDSTNELNTMEGPMPMVQDSYSHAGYEPSLMCEYDDLMPDPVQFVSLMGAPPPPPSQPHPQQYAEEEKDILPPGIDETESEFVPKPISDAPIPRKGPLPKDFEEALNIIFPGDKKPEDDSAATKSSGETQIITDEPVMQQSDLLKEGIHMMTVEETSLVGMDEASQMSMNEPLQFNKPSSAVATPTANNSGENSIDKSPPAVELVDEAVAAACISSIPPPPPPPVENDEKVEKQVGAVEKMSENQIETPERSMPSKELDIIDFESNLDTDQPPSPTESEKARRQEELDDLAMLGIDADDMAAQCI